MHPTLRTRSALLVAALFLAGCFGGKFDDSDALFSTDPTVDAATARKVIDCLLDHAPRIRQEKEAIVATTKAKTKLIVRVENAPDPKYPAMDPDTGYHRNYYWLYVGYHQEKGIYKYYRYLVHQDLGSVLFYDDATDKFIPVKP